MASFSTPGKTPFKIVTITEKDKPNVLQYLKQYYNGHEPLSQCLNRDGDKGSAVDERAYTSVDVADEGLSLIATTSSGEIVGVALNSSLRKNKPKSENSIEWNANTLKAINLIKQLEAETVSLGKSQDVDGKEMTARVIGVHPQWRNRGIGSALWERSRELAKQNDFTHIRSICTSDYSARILEKLGFQCIHSVRYEDYKENGESVIKPDPPHTHIKSMFLKI